MQLCITAQPEGNCEVRLSSIWPVVAAATFPDISHEDTEILFDFCVIHNSAISLEKNFDILSLVVTQYKVVLNIPEGREDGFSLYRSFQTTQTGQKTMECTEAGVDLSLFWG